jgi:hypothetical protein
MPSRHPNRAVLIGAAVLGAGYAAIKWYAVDMYPSDFGGFKGLLFLAVPFMAGILAVYAATLGCSLNGLFAQQRVGEVVSATRILSVVAIVVGVVFGIVFGPAFAAWPGF